MRNRAKILAGYSVEMTPGKKATNHEGHEVTRRKTLGEPSCSSQLMIFAVVVSPPEWSLFHHRQGERQSNLNAPRFDDFIRFTRRELLKFFRPAAWPLNNYAVDLLLLAYAERYG